MYTDARTHKKRAHIRSSFDTPFLCICALNSQLKFDIKYDEHDVIARLAEEDWGVIEEMVGAAKPVRESALVKIIMPFHSEAGQTSKAGRPSRRGGRRGMTRRRSSESLDTMAAAATALRESFAL